MDCGFETLGNAILLCHDGGPLLVTDPWLTGPAYFGSWTFSHEIPAEQMESIRNCRYAWVSHGHPDHLSSRSLALLKTKKILLPDHAGGRIAASLREQGYDVTILPDRRWFPLSERARVLSIADYNQDGILLVDLNGRLIMNLNDSSDRGWAGFVRRIAAAYRTSFLLRLSGFGDADMLNLYDEHGKFIPPRAARKDPPGEDIARMTEFFGAKYFVPFSSMHKYQRSDSVWVNEYTTNLDDYAKGFKSDLCELLPAFVRYDCVNDGWERLEPKEFPRPVLDPKEFGDDWSESLSVEDVEASRRYFQGIEHLSTWLDYINLRVGGKDNIIELAAEKRFRRGITFEAPRGSLMISVREQVFDDMLIGNFMKTTLHGKWPQTNLYPDFTPYVGKYADNGLARTEEQLESYFTEYRRRAPLDYLTHRLDLRSKALMRSVFHMDSAPYRLVKGAYKLLRG